MLHNYLTVAWRCLVRDGTTSVVNVAGLTLAIACALLAALFIRHELTYDRFHENGDRIFRFRLVRPDGYNLLELPANASSAMRDAFPEIERIARVQGDYYTDARVEDAERVELDVLLVDPDFLRMFSYPEMAGKGPEALADPQSVVLTESAARRLFDGEALGRTVTLRVNQGQPTGRRASRHDRRGGAGGPARCVVAPFRMPHRSQTGASWRTDTGRFL